MLQLEMLIRNFGTTLLKYVLVENTIMIFLFLVATLTQVGTSYKRSNYGSKRSIGPFDLTHRNRAGIRFSTYLELNNLVAVTTYYKKNNYATWTNPKSKLPHQIEHIITQKNDFGRFRGAGETTPLIYSDHKAVRCELRIGVHLKR